MVLIFKKLDYKNMMQAFAVCKRWNEIINGFELLKVKHFCKYTFSHFLGLNTLMLDLNQFQCSKAP